MYKFIWQCDADKKTAQEAMAEFCQTYWDKPRKHKMIGSGGYFKLKGGNAVYVCCYHRGAALREISHPGMWHIIRKD